MKYKMLLSITAAVSVVFFCCQKNALNVAPIGSVNGVYVANQKGAEALLIGAYSLLDGFALDINPYGWGGSGSNWIYGSICGSEAYKGSTYFDPSTGVDQPDIAVLEVFNPTPQNEMIAQRWKVVYAGVARANQVLKIMAEAKDIQPADRDRISGEAKFLRGFYHFEAIKMWHKVPFVDETVDYDAANYYVGNDTLIWPAIENDFKYAMQHLPFTQQTAPGRANYYAAEAYLAKAYLFEQRYSDAQPLLNDLIENGMTAGGIKYKLQDHYGDNFNALTKNSSESVFASQSSVNDGSHGWNGDIGDILNFPSSLNSPGQCCGFFQPSQYLVNHFKTDSSTGLPDLDNFNDSDVKNDQYLPPDSSFVPYAGTLDPRLDWTVGRRGIPYLDWGNHPGTSSDWIRESPTYGPYSPKKNAYLKSELGNLTDAEFWTTGSTAMNINLLRFADVLLWGAEVEIEVGDLNKAREYVNRVRRRASNSSGWVHTYIDPANPSLGFTNISAANYYVGEYTTPWVDKEYARKAVRFERMLELAMEGHRFFDLVRWGIAETEITQYFQHERKNHAYMNDFTGFAKKDEYFPIPQLQLDLSFDKNGVQHLHQNPGY